MCCDEDYGHHHHDCCCDEDRDHDCCCDDLKFHRRFQTKAEQIAELEEYLTALKTEVQAVEEMLADLRK
jgi:hypothetical protein